MDLEKIEERFWACEIENDSMIRCHKFRNPAGGGWALVALRVLMMHRDRKDNHITSPGISVFSKKVVQSWIGLEKLPQWAKAIFIEAVFEADYI